MTLYHLALCRTPTHCPAGDTASANAAAADAAAGHARAVAVSTDAVRATCGCAAFEQRLRSLS